MERAHRRPSAAEQAAMKLPRPAKGHDRQWKWAEPGAATASGYTRAGATNWLFKDYPRGGTKQRRPADFDNLAWLIGEWQASWKLPSDGRGKRQGPVSPERQRNYRLYLRDLDHLLDYPLMGDRALDADGVSAMKEHIARTRGTGAANAFLCTVRALFSWGVKNRRKHVSVNPVDDVNGDRQGELPQWTEEEAETAMTPGLLPEPWRRVVVLGYHTGLRRTDLVRLPWAAYDGTHITLRTSKTGKPIKLRVVPELKAELEAWRSPTVLPLVRTILVSPKGRLWNPDHVSGELARYLAGLGLRGNLGTHGLRKLMAARLAAAGATVSEMMAILGHDSERMSLYYARQAEQDGNAEAAMEKLRNARAKRLRKRAEAPDSRAKLERR